MDDMDDLDTLDLHQLVLKKESEVTEKLKEYRFEKDTIKEIYKKKLKEKNGYGYTPLHCAAKYNRYQVLEEMIQMSSGLDVVSEKEKFTVLHFMIHQKSTDVTTEIKAIVDTLLNNEKFICILQKSENPILHLACQNGNLDMVKILLRQKEFHSDILRQHPSTKNSPLHEATLSGNADIVDILIEEIGSKDELFKALTDKKYQNCDEMSPIHIACLDKHIGIAEKFFENIKNVDGTDQNDKVLANSMGKKQKSPLHYACQGGSKRIVELLLKHNADITSNENGTFPIHITARYGHCHLVHDVLGGKSVNVVDKHQNTPLNIATTYNKVEMIEELLKKSLKADTSIMNNELHTPLICAAIRGNYSAYKALVSRGASVTDTDANGRNIIHIAADKNHWKLLKSILKAEKTKVLCNLLDNESNTPLHLAAKNGHIECVKQLIPEDLEAENKDKQSPPPGAVDNLEADNKEEQTPHTGAATNLEAENKDKQTPLHCAAKRGHYSVIKCLLGKSCRFLVPDKDGNTALHLACQNGHYEATELLLQSQIGLNQRNRNRRTPLDVAALNGHAKVVELLMTTISECHPKSFLCNLVNPSDEHDSPLHLAITHGHLEVVLVLVKREAKVYLVNHDSKKTPLQVAIEYKHEAIAKEILKDKKNMKEALECEWISKDEAITTPFKELIKRMPTLARLVLEKANHIQEDPPGLNASFKFKFSEKDEGGHSDHARVNSCCSTNKDRFFPWKVCGPFASKKVIHPLLVMIEWNRKELLEHHFIKHICDQKWFDGGVIAYILAFLAYTIFVISLTVIALYSPNQQESSCKAIMNGTFGQAKSAEMYLYNSSECMIFNASFCEDSYYSIVNGDVACSSNSTCLLCRLTDAKRGKRVRSEPIVKGTYRQAKSAKIYLCKNMIFNASFCEDSYISIVNGTATCSSRTSLSFRLINEECDEETHAALITLRKAMMVMIFVQILFEIFQFYTNGWWYLKDWTNYLDILLYISSFFFIFPATNYCACLNKWQWQIGCVAVFLAWIDLLTFLRMGPGGIHILMFEKIFKSFLKTILPTSILVTAFSFVFYMQFYPRGPQSPFSPPVRAPMKVMAMTIGELDFDSLFPLDPKDMIEKVVKIPFFDVSIILWILFLIMMPILLSNLLTGLAIDDVKTIRERAAMRNLQLQMEFTLHVQELITVIPDSILCCKKKCREWTKPDEHENMKLWIWYLYFMTFFNLNKNKDAATANSEEMAMESLMKITSNVKDVMKKMAMTESALKSSITETVEKEVKTSMEPAIKETMEREIKTSMEPAIKETMEREIKTLMEPAIKQTMEEIKRLMEPAIKDTMEREMKTLIESALKPAIKETMKTCMEEQMKSSMK